MKHGMIGLALGLTLASVSAQAQGIEDSALCVDYFGVGALQGDTCRPFEGKKAKIGPADLEATLSGDVANLKIVSEDNPAEAFDLGPLAGVSGIHSLNLFRVGPIDLAPLESMQGLRSLHLGADAALGLAELSGALPDLAELSVFAPNRVVDLTALAQMPNLRKVYIKADGVTGQSGLRSLGRLERAAFELATETDFSDLSGLSQLEWLEISGTLGKTVLRDVGFMTGLSALTNLDLNTNAIEDLSPLAGLTNLRLLILSYNKRLTDIGPLAGLTDLRTLQIRNTGVADLTPLRDMNALGVLWLSRAPVADIEPLRDLPKLWGLELDNTNVTDISALRDLPLKHLSLRGTKVTDFSAVPSGTKLKK